MEKLPDITMEPEEVGELEGDIKVVEQMEDLKADPFIRAEPIKPEMVVEEKPVKAKRQISEKQKLHLANARKLAREKKALVKKQKNTKVEPPPPAGLQEPEPPNDGMSDEIKEQKKYMDWLDNMGKYKKMMEHYKKEQEDEAARVLKKEKDLEAKYFKKFKEQQKEPEREEIKEESVLTQGFGEYSNYF